MKKLMATIIFLSFGASAFAAQFKTVTEDVSYSSYSASITYPVLLSNSVPGYKAINEQVRTYLIENGCDTEEPIQPNMDYDANAKIIALNKKYVGYEVDVGSYCGGAHPNYDTYNMTFDSQTGAAVDLEKEIPIQATEMSPEYHEFQSQLAILLYNNFDMKSHAQECFEDATKEEVLQQIKDFFPLITGLAANKKVVVRIYPPHVATVCAFSVRVNYDDVKKYLNPEGSFQKWLKK